MSIKHWPKLERPREKLLHQGAASLSDAELLAIFLRTGINGKSAVDLARELLQQFGGLRQLLMADQQQFCQAKGLGSAKFALLQALLEMAKRHQWQALQRYESLTTPKATADFLQSQLRDAAQEKFCCLYLDNRHRLIKFETLFTGTIDSASVYPREVIKAALTQNAAAVILAHNHPSGIASASAADRQITRTLVEALGLLDIRVLDHLVIGDNSTFSFAESGLL